MGITSHSSAEEIRTHRFGQHYAINSAITMDGELKISRGDENYTRAKATFSAKVPAARTVYIHYHPGRRG